MAPLLSTRDYPQFNLYLENYNTNVTIREMVLPLLTLLAFYSSDVQLLESCWPQGQTSDC